MERKKSKQTKKTKQTNKSQQKKSFYIGREQKKTKVRIIGDIWTLFATEEDYYKPKRVSHFWNNNYIEYENSGDKNINLSLDEYLNKIKPYLRNIIIDLQNSDAWKIQLTIAIDIISSKDAEEERVMDSMSNKIKFTSYNDTNEVVDELFELLRLRYQLN